MGGEVRTGDGGRGVARGVWIWWCLGLSVWIGGEESGWGRRGEISGLLWGEKRK